ncbi:cytochrome c [Novosphingobium sp. KCTC 2891]|uniref:c-type cytochrome n=1 Tax=Novosphingobium sp. KCTC 2891 TaxID=2989730 RepID=UPI002221E852|nr:cytochrome c [Novosphingobium sp. KCTC 2891]MCW1381402.1 cytochrome c [Novosphingobium sp. KCTC 2891]
MGKKTRIAALALAGITFAGAATLSSPGFAQDRPGPGAEAVQVSDEGKEVYETICQACHMADAKGGGESGAMIPALAGNKNLADKDYPTIILLKGRGGMPWFTDILTKQQIASVITYVRGHFNDYHDPVTVADIDRVGSANPPVPECNTCGH